MQGDMGAFGAISLGFAIAVVLGIPLLWAAARRSGVGDALFRSAYAVLGSAFGGWIIALMVSGVSHEAGLRFRLFGAPLGALAGLAGALWFALYVIRDAYELRGRAAAPFWLIYAVVLGVSCGAVFFLSRMM